MKVITWLGNSLNELRAFPKEAKQEIGYALDRLQFGLMPKDWKPISAVGQGVREIRIHCESEYRVIYIAKYQEAIYVLHTFKKKTQKTSKHDIDIAKQRFRCLQKNRGN